MSLSLDQEIKNVEDESNEILPKIVEFREERELRIEETRQEQGHAVVQSQAVEKTLITHGHIEGD